MVNLLIFLTLVWTCVGGVRMIIKIECGELPNGFINNFVFCLVGGPFSWIVGIGIGMYFFMELINDNLNKYLEK